MLNVQCIKKINKMLKYRRLNPVAQHLRGL